MRPMIKAVALAAALSVMAGAAASAGPASAPAPAAAAATDPPPERIALIRRYFVSVKLDERIQKLIQNMMPVMMNQATNRFPGMTQDKRDIVLAAVEEALAKWSPGYIDRMAIAYARILDDDEINAAIAFYDSPQGRSIVAKEGTMAPVAMKVMMEMEPALQSLMMDSICRKLDCRSIARPPSAGKS